MIPDLEDDDDGHFRAFKDLGSGFILCHAKEGFSHPVPELEASAISTYGRRIGVEVDEDDVTVERWARLHLPNGQIARSAWKETCKTGSVRRARNVKVSLDHPALRVYVDDQSYSLML